MKFPSRLIIVVMLIFAILFLFLAWERHENFAYVVIPFVVLGAATFVMAPQIDWWWYKRHPRDIDPIMTGLFQKHLLFYQRLNESEKLRFRQRVDLYLMGIEFMVPSKDEEKVIPEDLKHWIAAFSVMTTWGKENVENEKFEKIVAYMRLFPSPQFPKNFHASEIFEEDGVVILALEPMIHAVMNPTLCFNPVLYEFCRVFQMTYWSKNPEITETHWADLERISNFTKEQVLETMGLPDVDVRAVAMSYFLLFPKQFKAVLPQEHEQMQTAFNFSL